MKRANEKWKQIRYTKDPDELLESLIGSRYAEYRKRWRRAENIELVQDYPIHLDFEFQHGCNLRCPFCILQIDPKEFAPDHPYRAESRSKQISFEVFQRIIDEGVDRGLASITVGVNNEPLMMRDIARYIAYARDKGIVDIIMLTNATLLTEGRARELLDSGITKLFFSIDAIKEDTYRILRKNGDFRRVMDNINCFLQIKRALGKTLPLTRVSYVKCKVNEAETDEFVRYWESRVDLVCIQAFVTPAYGYSNYEEHKKLFQIKNNDIKKIGPCPQPYQRLSIYHDGSVHPCCAWYGSNLSVGNINDESIYEIWNSDRMKHFRAAVNSDDPKAVPKECRICRQEVFG